MLFLFVFGLLCVRFGLGCLLHDLRFIGVEGMLGLWVARVLASCALVTALRESVPTIRYDDN
ncbi:hypothetical protein, partial [Pseudomonas syringae group genomosp. 7]